ncbi:hypothetical protein GCM10010452_22150 [Crossiella cryophila]
MWLVLDMQVRWVAGERQRGRARVCAGQRECARVAGRESAGVGGLRTRGQLWGTGGAVACAAGSEPRPRVVSHGRPATARGCLASELKSGGSTGSLAGPRGVWR